MAEHLSHLPPHGHDRVRAALPAGLPDALDPFVAALGPSGPATPASDPLVRLSRITCLLSALDGAAVGLQEARDAGAIPRLTGAALRELGIESQISLLDAPIDAAGAAAEAAIARAVLRVAYVSISGALLRTVERAIGRPLVGLPIPLGRVAVFADAARTRRPLYVGGTAHGLRQIAPWVPASLVDELARRVGATTSVVAPMLSRGRILGVMSVWAPDLRPEDTTTLGAFARQVGIALDNARLAAEAERCAQRLASLSEIGRDVAGSRELDQVLARVVGHAARALGTAHAGLWLAGRTPAGDLSVHLAAHLGLTPEHVDLPAMLVESGELAATPVVRALRTRATQACADLESTPAGVIPARTRRFLLGQGYRCLVVAPVLTPSDEAIGTLIAYSTVPGALARDDGAYLEAIGRHAAVAIEHARALDDARRRADDLQTIFASVADGVATFALDGSLLTINAAGDRIVGHRARVGADPAGRIDRLRLRMTDGTSVAVGDLPSSRAIRGETFHNVEYLLHGEDGPDTVVSFSGAPFRGADGSLSGAAITFRNVTHVRRLERRTYEALDALLGSAALLVAPGALATVESADPAGTSLPALRATLRQLCSLAIGVLGCDRVGIGLVDPETLLVSPGAVAGLTPEQDARWQEEQRARLERGARSRLGDDDPATAARLQRGESVVLDMTRPPYDRRPNPLDIGLILVVPMLVEGRLVGILALDYHARWPDDPSRGYTPDVIVLAQGIARLAALAVERDGLLRVAAEVEALRAANALKEQFLSIASHELKTPLTVIQARAQSARRKLQRLGHAEAAAQFAPIQAAVDRIMALLQELLDVSRIESGHLDLHREPCDLGQLMVAAVEDARDATNRSIDLCGADAPGLLVAADPERLAQVAGTLLANAAKYSPPESPIDVRLRRRPAADGAPGGEIAVTVADSGVGIPTDEIPRVFERFYRASTSSARQYGGLGRGRYIAASIVERHGGRIWADSAGPDQGSVFGFALAALAAGSGPDPAR